MTTAPARGRTRAAMTTALTLALALAPLPAGPATAIGHVLTGLQYVEYFYPLSTADRKTASVDCPGSKVVVGTGFEIASAPTGDILIESVVPLTHGVTVTANEDEDLSPGSWGLRARATCANAPPGYQIVSDPSTIGSGPSNTAITNCGTDRVVTGTGFALPDTDGELALTRLDPLARTVSAQVHEDDTGFPANWTFTVYGICSYALDSLQITSSDTRHTDPQSELASCPTPTYALNAAGYFTGGAGNVRFVKMAAISLPGENYNSPVDYNYGIASGDADDDGSPQPYDMIGLALCAKALESP